MNAATFRTRVAVAWVAVAVAASGSLLLYLVTPGAMADMVAGEMEGEALTGSTGYMFVALIGIPLAMAAVTLLTGNRPTRYANLIIAALLGLFAAYAVGSHLAAGDFDGHVVMAALAGVLAFLVAGLAIAWLRTPQSGTLLPGSEQVRSSTRAVV
jgi:hypothetical protein